MLTPRLSRSRASSTSQLSICTPAPGESAVGSDSELARAKALNQGVLSRLRAQSSTLVADSAIDDDDVEGSQDTASVSGDSVTPETSQASSGPAIAKISITAPDTKVALPAEVPDTVEANQDDEPVVMHAHSILNNDWTLGTHVPFRDVCRAVKHSAFHTNPLPIIVSLEVHTNAVQQKKMVKIMKEEWGSLLLDQPLDGADPLQQLPTLGELQNKILVKVKKPYVPGWASPTKHNGPVSPLGMSGLGNSLVVMSPTESAGATSGSEDDVTGNNISTAATKNARITKELGSLAVYTEGRHFSTFADHDAKVPTHVFSLSEMTIKALHLKNHTDLFHHNKRYLMRAYPHATKHVSSSNPDPACCWRRGVQMVALNWQTLDKAMMLNHGMFHGSRGWVLKPSGYRGTTATAAAESVSGESVAPTPISVYSRSKKSPATMGPCPLSTAEPACTIDLYITVYAGQHLPLPPALMKKRKKHNGKTVHRSASAYGIVTGRGHASFRPIVKCELNVERADERCPEAPASLRTATHGSGSASNSKAASMATVPSNPPSATTVPSSAFSFSSTAVAASQQASAKPAAPVKLPEASVKKKTSASESDHPHWGVRGETLNFMNVTGIVESLSFITYVHLSHPLILSSFVRFY